MKKDTILLAVTGLSPQVITETLYALYKLNKPLPGRIILITTQIGANEAQKRLIDEGKIAQFCMDYQLKEIGLTAADICIIPDDDGIVTNDVNADKQMNTLADFICNKVQELTADDSNIIHASLAGGRKTMTFFLGMAMSFYGRKQDTLSHVLVSEGYESSDFFYPTPYSCNITNFRGSILDAQYAKVWLTHIPLVRLREELPHSLLEGKSTYSQTVNWLNYDPVDATALLVINKRLLRFAQKDCVFATREFAFYLWFCQRAIKQQQGLFIPDINHPDILYAKEFLTFYSQVVDEFKFEKLELYFKNKKGMTKGFFEEMKSRCNRMLFNVFGKKIGQHLFIKKTIQDYHIITEGKKKIKREKYRFAIILTSDKIKIMEEKNDIPA